MSQQPLGVPVVHAPGSRPSALRPVARATGTYDESWLQDVLYQTPECLPIPEIDSSYSQIVPVCRELSTTRAGFLDVLFATPQGRLVIVETKLWRNPEARRQVVGQVLDYAKEICRWTPDQLNAQVAAAHIRYGESVFDAVRKTYPEVDPRDFHDNLSRNLRLGRFMLLIVGDGIREGVGEIAEFLERYATMDFSLGLIEMSVYEDGDQRRLLVPRVVTRSETVKRWVISVDAKGVDIRDEDPLDAASDDEAQAGGDEWYRQFWSEFLDELRLDDPTQPRPRVTRIGLIFVPMPPSGGVAWVTVFFNRDRGEVGAFLTFRRGAFADSAYQTLLAERDQIEKELGGPVDWESSGDGKYIIQMKKRFGDLRASGNRQPIKQYLRDRVNHFVNVFRPRLKRIADAVG